MNQTAAHGPAGKRWLCALLLALALLIPQARGYPRTAEPAFGLRQLREHEVSQDGRRLTMDFVHEDETGNGRSIEVSYDLELAPGLKTHSTDEEALLAEVHATEPGLVRLVFESSSAADDFEAKLAESDVVHGHYQQQPGPDAIVHPYHVRVLAKARGGPAEPEVLMLTVETPGLTELFINGKAKVVVGLAPEDYHFVRADDGAAAHETASEIMDMDDGSNPEPVGLGHGPVRRKLNALGWVKTGLKAIQKLGETVYNIQNAVQAATLAAANAVVTGELKGSSDGSVDALDFNFDEARREPVCAFKIEEVMPKAKNLSFAGTCHECYAYSHLKMYFEIDIQNYELNLIEVLFKGNLDFSLAFDELNVTRPLIDGTSVRLGTFKPPKGIPIPLGHIATLMVMPTVPVHMGAEFEVAGMASFGIDMKATASLEAGLRWSKWSNPERQLVFKADFGLGGHGVWVTRVKGDAAVRLYILPVAKFDLTLGKGPLNLYMGGPNVAMKSYLEGMATLSTSDGAQFIAAYGAEATVGANMTLQLSSKGPDLLKGNGAIKPKAIYSQKFPRGTMRLPLSRQLLEGDDAIEHPADADIDGMEIKSTTLSRDLQNTLPLIPYDWASIGMTFEGRLEKLRECTDTDFIPPYLDATAIVLSSGLYTSGGPNNNGGKLDLAIAFSYGKDTLSEEQGELGAFAALDQRVYVLDLRGALPGVTQKSCENAATALLVPLDRDYADISYKAVTTDEAVELPRMYGGVCEDGNKIRLRDTLGCLSITLDRNQDGSQRSRKLSDDGASRNDVCDKFDLLNDFISGAATTALALSVWALVVTTTAFMILTMW